MKCANILYNVDTQLCGLTNSSGQPLVYDPTMMLVSHTVGADFIAHIADLSAFIAINLSREVRQEAGRSVGARVVGRGWEVLHGRPRPVPLAHLLEEHIRIRSRVLVRLMPLPAD